MSVTAENLKYVYAAGLPGETVALDDVSFKIADGEFVGIIGHTGSGKSTLVQHLNGLLRPMEGKVYVSGKCISDGSVTRAEISHTVGLVFQYPEYQLFEETVEKDVAFGPKNLGLSGKELQDTVDRSLRMVGLQPEKIKEKSPLELSGGQKRRVAIAGVLAMKPRVLILDEPTAGLDPAAKKEIMEMIYRLHDNKNLILFFVSHNMADIAAMTDRVLVMDHGKLIMDGTPKDVFARGNELRAVGLNVPPITEIMNRLSSEMGTDFGVVFDESEAAEKIRRFLYRNEKEQEKA